MVEASNVIEDLKIHIKNLDQEKFFEVYDTIDDPFEMEDCMITELFKHYPEILCQESNITSEESNQDLDIFQEEKQKIVKRESFCVGIFLSTPKTKNNNHINYKFSFLKT